MEPSSPPSCFSPDDLVCLMARNCTEGLHDSFPSGSKKLTFNRVRFPGTASSDQRNMMQQYEGKGNYRRYGNLLPAEGRGYTADARLCFAPASGGDEYDLDLAFRSVDSARAGSHGPYDTVEGNVMRAASRGGGGRGDGAPPVLLTTLREPLSYATKWYRFRESWDRTTDLSNYTFEEWIERAPWRMNFVARALGARGDRKSTAGSMLHTKHGEVSGYPSTDRDTFIEDAYMIEQNELGPEGSEVYQLALERLRNSFTHFGIFHRLPESWELLAHTLCWDLDDDKKHIVQANARGVDALRYFAKKYAKEAGDIDVERAARRLRERNRLDLALMEEAERLMDERLEVMRAEREVGVLCNFLGKIKVTCEGNDDAADGESSRDEL